MSEAKLATPSSTQKSVSFVSAMTATVTTLLLASIAAGCFIGVILGIRSLHPQRVETQLRQIDALLAAHPAWISSPAWVNRIQHVYHHWRNQAAQPSDICFSSFSTFSSSLPHFQGTSASADHNPIAREFSQICSALKTRILPLLTGVVAVVIYRLWVFITALPLLALSLGLGLIDGLVQRDIRKFQGAGETALLFHRLKRGGAALFFVPFFLYMAWLSPVSPLRFFLPMAAGLGLWLALTMRFFKKSV
jgi:integrating conjugative element membrane protein (TIGR03747 family)